MEVNKTSSFEKSNDLSISNQFINDKKNISLRKRTKNDNNLFLTQNNSRKDLEKCNKNKSNIQHIRNLLNPQIHEFFFDGYAVKRKKYSFEELIKKVGQKEKKECLEKNKLFKSPYPLIKFLSNRKLYNNSSSLLSDLLNNDTSKLSKEQLLIINKKDENKKKKNITLYTNKLSYSHNHFNKQNYLLDLKKNKVNKLSKTINLKKNIRLYDYLNFKYHLNLGTNINMNNYKDNFIICNYNKNNLPLFNRYIKNKVFNNTSINNKMVFNLKNKHVNRSLKKIYLNTELLNLNKKFNNINISNTSINNEENESCKIKSVSNTIFNKKNKYHNLRKILLNKNI